MAVLDALSLDIIAPAFVAGALVLTTHVPLGSMVLNRGIVFIDIAVAQVAALGVVIGAALVGELGGIAAQVSAFSAALLCSLFLIWSEKRFGEYQEAIIGVTFVVAAAVQIIALSASPGGAEHLKDLLVGQILLVTTGDLILLAVAYAGVLAVWALRDLAVQRLLFYGMFAVVITLSVQIIGVLLVFASLIVPALAARTVPERWRLIMAYNVGIVGYGVGLVCSALFNVPTGATIVCAIVVTAIAGAMVASVLMRQTGAEQTDDLTDTAEQAGVVTLHLDSAGLRDPGLHREPAGCRVLELADAAETARRAARSGGGLNGHG